MTDKKALPKPFVLLVERILSRVFCSCCTTDTIYRIVKQFEETGSVCHKHTKGHKRNPFIHEEEVVVVAWEAIARSPREVCDAEHVESLS
jgi:transposase